MSLIRVSIEISSRLRTPLRGDTIWGHIACGIANHEGQDGVVSFCNMNPPFVVSSAFPHNMIVKPLLPPEEDTKDFSSREEYTKFKKNKKSKFQKASDLFDFPSSESNESIFISNSYTHISISRDSGVALDEKLFTEDAEWPKEENCIMDIYVSSSLPHMRIKELFSWAFEFGYGADSSIGAGRIRVIGDPEEMKVKKPLYGRYMALGPFIVPEGGQLFDLRSSTFIRKGKIGGILSRDISPFKKSVILYEEGATFICDGKKEYVGRLLHNMHGTTEYDICHSAFAPVVEV